MQKLCVCLPWSWINSSSHILSMLLLIQKLVTSCYWKKDMTLSQMIGKAQRFENFKGAESSKAKKTLRTTETSSVIDQLKSELAELRKHMANLQASLEKKSSTTVQGPRKSFICWNCGGWGHIARHCKKPKVGDGFTFRPKTSQKTRKQESPLGQDPLN